MALGPAPMTVSRLLQLQAAGNLPAPVRPFSLRHELRQGQAGRPRGIKAQSSAPVALWVSNTSEAYLIGVNKHGNVTRSAIDAESKDCDAPVGLKVDAKKNLWVACESSSAGSGLVQNYGDNATLAATYAQGCPSGLSCDYWYSYGFDTATDNAGHVFASIVLYEIETASQFIYGTGFEWWNAAAPSSPPTLISLPSSDSVSNVDFMDVDASGDLWFDYYGCVASGCGYGLGEITAPTTSPAFVAALAPGSIGFAGGVYVSKHGSVLNVIDQDARTTSQYALPWVPSEKPTTVLGPTLKNSAGDGDPVSGGFSKYEGQLAEGDAYGWLDIGTVSTNGWTIVTNPDFSSGIEGAAYTPSDK